MKPNDLSKFSQISKEIRVAVKHTVNVGVAKDVGNYPNGESIMQVGIWHEYGTKKNIPRRSFLRMPFIEKKEDISKAIAISWKKIMKGESTALKEFGKIGIMGQNISKDAFATGGFGKWQALEPRTIKAKGSEEILIDTGKLVQSITNWVAKI